MTLKSTIERFIPGWLFNLVILALSVRPLQARTCPICRYRGAFSHFGRPPRLDARCPRCGALERHRLFWLWFEKARGELRGPVLHFAPEEMLVARLRSNFPSYTTADLVAPADAKLNIESITRPDATFGTVICNHVLEHVDDRKALAEIHRVLAPDGLLVVSVPIIEAWEQTYENADIRDPRQRQLHYGNADHVRYYGRDFRDRLREAGFTEFSEVTANGPDAVEYGLLRGDTIFVCRK